MVTNYNISYWKLPPAASFCIALSLSENAEVFMFTIERSIITKWILFQTENSIISIITALIYYGMGHDVKSIM